VTLSNLPIWVSFIVEIEYHGVEFHTCLSPYCHRLRSSLSPPCRRYQSPALYQQFKHSVALIISSPSLFRAGERVSFVPLKTRSVSELIAGIDRISNAIAVSCGEPELAHQLMILKFLLMAVVELLMYASNSSFGFLPSFRNASKMSSSSSSYFGACIASRAVSIRAFRYSLSYSLRIAARVGF
jgi:hypothetical protein